MKTAKIIFATFLLLTLFSLPTAVFAHTSLSKNATVVMPTVIDRPCSETGYSGPQLQENRLFCASPYAWDTTAAATVISADATNLSLGQQLDGTFVYYAAISAASHQPAVILGWPTSTMITTDWGNMSITYVTFSSGFHMEYHPDNVVRIYNTLNQRVS